MKIPRKIWIALLTIPIVILLDQWTKQIILDRFYLHESVPVLKEYFAITYVRNTGAAFGFLADSHPSFRVPFFFVVPVIALFVMSWLFVGLKRESIRGSLALSLIVGGAIGNLIDRVKLGYVVDFLDFHWRYTAHFPAFNVADSAICVGVGLLLLDSFNEKPQGKT